MYLLDTNVISEIRKADSGRADTNVVRWTTSMPTSVMFISVVTVHELELGVLLAERNDPPQGAVLRAWLNEDVLPAFESRIVPIDTSVAIRAATLHVPDPAPYGDALIGATAAVHRMTVATRNTHHFERFVGVDVLNPWN